MHLNGFEFWHQLKECICDGQWVNSSAENIMSNTNSVTAAFCFCLSGRSYQSYFLLGWVSENVNLFWIYEVIFYGSWCLALTSIVKALIRTVQYTENIPFNVLKCCVIVWTPVLRMYWRFEDGDRMWPMAMGQFWWVCVSICLYYIDTIGWLTSVASCL